MAPSFVVPPTPSGGYSSPCRAEFTVQALGLHQHDAITISLLSAPPGSSISTPITSNPGSTIFTWQPPPQLLESGQQTGQACFQARDRTGLTRNKCLQVTVSGGMGCVQQPPPAQPQPQPQLLPQQQMAQRPPTPQPLPTAQQPPAPAQQQQQQQQPQQPQAPPMQPMQQQPPPPAACGPGLPPCPQQQVSLFFCFFVWWCSTPRNQNTTTVCRVKPCTLNPKPRNQTKS